MPRTKEHSSVHLRGKFIAIVAAGAMLIFGGDMNGFMKTLVFIVLVLAFVIAAQNMLTAITGTGTVIAQSLLGIDITSQFSKS